jgi:3-hexulose-6-phosphate synthase
MKLQAALDYFTLKQALNLMEQIHPYVDIAEIGSPLMFADGFHSVAEIKKRYPKVLVLADMKVVDGGYDIASAAYKVGADIATTIGLTTDDTLLGVVKAAREHNKYCMVDTIGIGNLPERVKQFEEMGFDYILLHTAHDTIGSTAEAASHIDKIKEMKQITRHAKIGISGGITLSIIKKVCAADPDWVVIGGGLTSAKDPAETVKALRKFIVA